MNYIKEINKKLVELRKRKVILERDYDSLLPGFIDKNRHKDNHESYTRMLNVTYTAIHEIDIQINLLEEIKDKAQ